jgi:hypothetical protein
MFLRKRRFALHGRLTNEMRIGYEVKREAQTGLKIIATDWNSLGYLMII